MQRNSHRSPAGKTRRHTLACAAILSVCAFALGACTSSQSGPQPQGANGGPALYIVTADKAPFFKYGPAQQGGADYQLKKNQVVTMVDRKYGYSRVLDPDGDSGFVPTDDLMPAPNQSESSSIVTPPKNTGSGSGNARSVRAVAPTDIDQPNDATLPSKQPPADQAPPNFRY